MARIIQTENGVLQKQYFIDKERIDIGRADSNHIQLSEKVISSRHAQIFIEKDHHGNEVFFLQDLNSKNGSYINQTKVICKQLKHEDSIQFGHHKFTFIDDNEYL